VELNLILMKSAAESDDKLDAEDTAEHADWNDEGTPSVKVDATRPFKWKRIAGQFPTG
jgi:hypothetical protein